MRRLPKLWRSLERITGLLEVPAAWEAESGEDFGFLLPHLRPTEMVGALYPCPRHFGECPRKIVDYGDGEYAALCRDPHKSCEAIPLAPRDALLHDLDLSAFLKPALQAASIRPEAPKARGPGIWSLGLSGRRSSLNQPAFLVIAHSKASFNAAVRDLLLEIPGPFLLVVPTNSHRTVDVQERLQARNVGYLCLEEHMLIDNKGNFISLDPLESTDNVPATPPADRKRVVKEFTKKHRCKVADIQKAAGVYETDYYAWLKNEDPDHYAHCGRIERVLHHGLPKPVSPKLS